MARPSLVADARPLAIDDTETALFEGEAVVCREATKSIHRLNASAAAVWVCCDGETTVADMIAELADVFAAGSDETERVVRVALDQSAELGLLAGNAAPPSIGDHRHRRTRRRHTHLLVPAGRNDAMAAGGNRAPAPR